ncbi:MAG: fumarylacetoacetate hydrolase family protein [Bacteroidia bacterium]|nr:fumarylacetoacetate hydrolase family protein [Bacteroidia bacterium]
MKILCVGRNYREHAKELNNPVPDSPMIFFKPDTAVVRENKDVYYPAFTKDLHFECELVVRIGKEAKHIEADYVHKYIDGIGLGIDLTARDVQEEIKKKGWPWTLAKGFDASAPVSEFTSPSALPPIPELHFRCAINGEVRQNGDCADMIFSVPTLIAYITSIITLKKGDLIFTGTPAGVGPLHIGDHLEAWLEGEKLLDFHVR